MPIYRTINQCFSSIYNEDTETAITKFFIRKLCEDNKVRYLKAGNKILIDWNSLVEFLQH